MDIFRTQSAPSTGLVAVPLGLGAPRPTVPAAPAGLKSFLAGSTGRILSIIFGLILLIVVVYYAYEYFLGSKTTTPTTSLSSAGDLLPSAVNGKTVTTIASSNFTTGDSNDYGLNFWMYIKDWDTNFGKEKTIFSRGTGNPTITLHPTDNSLNVKVAVYPAGATSATATSTTGDIYTCTVENVPLQAWFAVSVTVFQRNLDIYINGQLVKSCVLPGVPKLASGDGKVGGTTGFSGSMCTMKYVPRGLVPADALAFYSAGTPCGTAGGSAAPAGGITLFGYTFRFSIFKRGETQPAYELASS